MTVGPPDDEHHPFDRSPFFGYSSDDGSTALPQESAEEPGYPPSYEPVPGRGEPVYEEPVYGEPVYEDPQYAAPVYEETEYVEPGYGDAVYGEPPGELTYAEPPDRSGCAPLVILLVALLVLALLVFGTFLFRRGGHGTASTDDPTTTVDRFLADIKDKDCDAARHLMTDDLVKQLQDTCGSDNIDQVEFDDVTVVDRNDTIARVSFRVRSVASSYVVIMRLVKKDDRWLIQNLID